MGAGHRPAGNQRFVTKPAVNRSGATARTRARQIENELRSLGDPSAREGQARFGIQTRRALGISMPKLRAIARREGKDHELALALWASGIHESRILAALVDDPAAVTEAQMEEWAGEFDSWDLVDQCCGALFDRTPWAYPKAVEWAGRREEFVKRAGFSLMAQLAVHDKRAPDERFHRFLPIIEREAADPRNFVKKAVNWALRGIGKRSLALNALAVETAIRIQARGTGAARWVASDALRELRNAQVVARIRA
jgi:3-methyladenine DNA glycosylase AlkD